MTREQTAKVSGKSREIGVPVAVMFVTAAEGENGVR